MLLCLKISVPFDQTKLGPHRSFDSESIDLCRPSRSPDSLAQKQAPSTVKKVMSSAGFLTRMLMVHSGEASFARPHAW